MKRSLLYAAVAFSISIYFILTVFVLPAQYLSNEQLVPQPYFEAALSESEIHLGESFRFDVVSENRGDYGDIHIVSTAFPDLSKIENVVEITTYDFTQSPVYISSGDEIVSGYSGGLESTISQYPSIEAMTRPIPAGMKYNFGLLITPEKLGIFTIYVKSVDIPHINNLSHYPDFGILDHQNEHVLVYSVNVK